MIPSFREIHIENTNSCGYKCVMCPRESQTRKVGFMPLEDFSLVLERVGPFQGLFHLHGYGEPLLDRTLSRKIELLKAKNPTAESRIITTLGVRLKEADFARLLQAGLNGMIISFYGFIRETYREIHGRDAWDLAKHNLSLLAQAMKRSSSHAFKAFIKIPSLEIHSALSLAPSPERMAFCSWAQELGYSIGEWTYVHNYGSGRNYNLPNSQTLCPVIAGKRRNILNITWDLGVIPCCYDFDASIRFGNLREQTLEEIFSSPAYFAFLIAHQAGEFSAHPICKNCEKIDSAHLF